MRSSMLRRGRGQVCCVAESAHISGVSEADRDGAKLLD